MEKELMMLKESILSKADFMMVGSYALKEAGFDVTPHDLDIEVIATEELETVFKALAKANNNDFHEEYISDAEKNMDNVTWRHKPYIFKFCEVEVNVWAVDRFSHPYLVNKDGIKIAKPLSVLAKKLAFRRPKDYKTLNNIIKQISEIGL